MTEREKMLAGLQYDCGDPELLDRWHLARALTLRYNQTDSRDSRAQRALLSPVSYTHNRAPETRRNIGSRMKLEK